MIDLVASLSLLGVGALLASLYAVRVALAGRARAARVDREGKSALLGKSVMEMMYWSIGPVGAGLARLGVAANAVTWTSLVVAIAAGVALGAGHFGVGAALALVAAAGDALDGFIARATGTSSDAGEVLDAAVDRYGELAFLAGVGVAFRASVPLLTLTMAAIAASFMVSYSTAKAEALQIEPPRGSMRRTERAVVLIAGAGLTPIVPIVGLEAWSRAPMVAALAIVAVAGNASAARRLASLARSIRAREASTLTARSPKVTAESSPAPSPTPSTPSTPATPSSAAVPSALTARTGTPTPARPAAR